MNFLLHGRIGPFPAWAVAGVVVIGGVVLFIWLRNRQANNNAAAPTNPLNATNDPNIDPNTGVPYALEEAIDPNTGIPFYFENNPGAKPPPAPTPPPTPKPVPQGKPPKPCPKGYHRDYDGECVKDKGDKDHDKGGNKSGYLGPPLPHKVGTGPEMEPASTYTFAAGPSGQTSHIGGVAIDQYGVTSASDINNTSAAIIRANPSLAGQNSSYQPPVGTRIYLPNM